MSKPAPFLPHILIVEDDPAYADSLSRYLGAHNLRVTVAHAGSTGLVAHDCDPADIVLLDCKLPDMNGRQILLDLRARNPRLPIMVVTAYPQEMNWGEVALMLTRPIGPDAVYERLCPLLNGLPEGRR